MKRVNCAIYVRKSTEKGLDMEFNSLQNQEEACKNYILSQAFNGWEYFKTYTDSGISGGTMNRAALQEMLEDMKKGLIQIVVTYKVDRLSRSIIDFHNMMKEFEKYNCDFVSITQSFDTSTSMGKLTLNMLLSFAQFEREVSSERIRDKLAASKRKGYWTGGPPPLGYDVVGKKLVVNEKEAEDVRFIFRKYLELGSLSKLREFLADTDLRTKKWFKQDGESRGGVKFGFSQLALMLRSSIYIGRIQYKKENITFPGLHEPIVDKKVFVQVQALMDSNQNKHNKTHEMNSFLLTRKLVDSLGNVFKNQKSSKSSTKKYRYYNFDNIYIPAGDFDEITVGVMKRLFGVSLCTIIGKSKEFEFKTVDFNNLNAGQQETLIKAMIDKIIYHKNKMMYFIRIDDLSCLNPYKRENYLNTDTHSSVGFPASEKMFVSDDKKHLIIEKEVCFNNRHRTNRFIGKSRKIISIEENNSNLVKALSTAWRYGKMIEKGMAAREIEKVEKRTGRTIYRYLNLYYLSPRIVNDIMASNAPSHIDLQALFGIASKYGEFEEQEREFYNKIDLPEMADV
jgi:site-specific DNA recombinase